MHSSSSSSSGAHAHSAQPSRDVPASSSVPSAASPTGTPPRTACAAVTVPATSSLSLLSSSFIPPPSLTTLASLHPWLLLSHFTNSYDPLPLLGAVKEMVKEGEKTGEEEVKEGHGAQDRLRREVAPFMPFLSFSVPPKDAHSSPAPNSSSSPSSLPVLPSIPCPFASTTASLLLPSSSSSSLPPLPPSPPPSDSSYDSDFIDDYFYAQERRRVKRRKKRRVPKFEGVLTDPPLGDDSFQGPPPLFFSPSLPSPTAPHPLTSALSKLLMSPAARAHAEEEERHEREGKEAARRERDKKKRDQQGGGKDKEKEQSISKIKRRREEEGEKGERKDKSDKPRIDGDRDKSKIDRKLDKDKVLKNEKGDKPIKLSKSIPTSSIPSSSTNAVSASSFSSSLASIAHNINLAVSEMGKGTLTANDEIYASAGESDEEGMSFRRIHASLRTSNEQKVGNGLIPGWGWNQKPLVRITPNAIYINREGLRPKPPIKKHSVGAATTSSSSSSLAFRPSSLPKPYALVPSPVVDDTFLREIESLPARTARFLHTSVTATNVLHGKRRSDAAKEGGQGKVGYVYDHMDWKEWRKKQGRKEREEKAEKEKSESMKHDEKEEENDEEEEAAHPHAAQTRS